MTMLAFPELEQRPTLTVLERPAGLDDEEALAKRAQAVEALDADVRRHLSRIGGPLPVQVSPATVYDAIYAAAPEIGGHWSATSTWMGFLTHTILSYNVALAFDQEQQPSHFVISGSRTVRSRAADGDALSVALQEAASAGPMRTTAPHAFPGFAF